MRELSSSSSYYLLPPLDEKSTTQSGKVSYMARKDGNTDKIQSEVINGNISREYRNDREFQMKISMNLIKTVGVGIKNFKMATENRS